MSTHSLQLFERIECSPVRPPLVHDVAIHRELNCVCALALSSDVMWLMFVVCVVRNETQAHTYVIRRKGTNSDQNRTSVTGQPIICSTQ